LTLAYVEVVIVFAVTLTLSYYYYSDRKATNTHNTAESDCVEADLTNNNVLTGQPQPCPEGKATADNQSTAKDSVVNKQRQHQRASEPPHNTHTKQLTK
jgi:regulatory protein YycI of two-component signal transduction system YycFG